MRCDAITHLGYTVDVAILFQSLNESATQDFFSFHYSVKQAPVIHQPHYLKEATEQK